MTILAILQNQWFKDPDHVRRLIEKCEPERRVRYRRKMIEYALFAGCKTGKVLKKVLGPHLCEQIVWEEASPRIGGHASSSFPADLDHLRTVIAEVDPRIIIAFGSIAAVGLMSLQDLTGTRTLIFAPHPTARHATAYTDLVNACATLREAIAKSAFESQLPPPNG